MQRQGGASVRTVLESGPLSVQPPPDGVGRYETSETINVAWDGQLPDHASWRLHLGTWDEARWPRVHVNLAAAPHLADMVLGLDCRDRVTITNLPSVLPPGDVDVIAEGYAETLGLYDWDVTLNCSPGRPWRVAEYDTARYGTAGSVLTSAVGSGDTTLTVSTAGPLWTSAVADMPIPITVGGEDLSVTAVTNGAADTFTRSTTSGWGTSSSGHTWTHIGGAATDYPVVSSIGRMDHTAINVWHRSYLTVQVSDFDLEADLFTNALAVSDAIFVQLMARATGTGTHEMYEARLELRTNQTVFATIRCRTTTATTPLASGTVPGITHAANTRLKVRFQGEGPRLRMKVWDQNTTEPQFWHLAATDTTYASGVIGAASLLGPASTNTLPVRCSCDELVLRNPQRMTVVRSVNGITKGHPAGAAVALADPAIRAL